MREFFFVLAAGCFLLGGALAIYQNTIQATAWLRPVTVCLMAGLALLTIGMMLN